MPLWVPFLPGKSEGLHLRKGLRVGLGEGHTEGLAPSERLPVGVGVLLLVPLPLLLPAAVPLSDGEPLLQGVTLGLAPHDSVVLALALCVVFSDGVPLKGWRRNARAGGGSAPRRSECKSGRGDALPERLAEAVVKGNAPRVSGGVGDAESVLLALAVVLGVLALVLVPVAVGLPVPVGLKVQAAVALLESGVLPARV